MAEGRGPDRPIVDELSEGAALAVLAAHGLKRVEVEDPLVALGWALGEGISHEEAFRAFAKALVDELGVPDLLAAKIELLGEYKLDYPQDYEPDDVDRMEAEIERLRGMAERLAEDEG